MSDAYRASASPTTACRDLDPHPGLLLQSVVVCRTGEADRTDGTDGRSGEDLAEQVRRVGARPRGGPWLIDAIDESGLTGRGGGHFPAARKWRSALGAGGAITVVANGAESEPFSAKDATLLRQRPHLVLDGLACASETLRAVRGVVWLHERDVHTRRVVGDAIDERHAAGVDAVPVAVVTAPSCYLSGESSAIASALAGGPVLPTFRGARRSGVPSPGGPVTVVHNVETLARVAMAARECAPGHTPDVACFTPGPPTTLLTIVTPTSRDVMEVWSLASLREAVECSAWPAEHPPVAVLLGGFGGGWSRWDDVAAVEVDEAAMRARGATLGAGIIAPIDRGACGVAETAAIVRYLADSSAGQCGPCVHGLAAVAHSLETLRRGTAPRRERRRLAADLEAIRDRGACHHPDGAVRMVASALDVFRPDVELHATGRPCAHADRLTLPVPTET